MNKLMKILSCILFFMMITMFTGAVSAANLTVNPGDSIQAVINNASDNDTIVVNDNNGSAYTYKENLVINKTLQLQVKEGENVTIQAINPSKSVISINSGGKGSVIQGFVVRGATGTDSYGIYLNSANDCIIIENTVMDNWRGIEVTNSNNTALYGNIVTNSIDDGLRLDFSNNITVSGNNVTNNGWNGILLAYSNNNAIIENTVTNNIKEGIYLRYTNNNGISENIVTNNGNNGIYSYYSNNNTITGNNIVNNSNNGICINYSSAGAHFNRITGNGAYGLYNLGNGTVNATNNWWGSNNNPSSEIKNVGTGCVTYDPWLVLNVTSSCDRSTRTGPTYNYIITADLTHNNQGKDISPTPSDNNSPYNPYEIPLYFNTTLGTIETSTITVRGKSIVTLSSTRPDIANVTTTLDKQTISLSINVNSINVLGVCNTRTNQRFGTIQAAINDTNTQNGDTITLADGTYTENIIVSKGITLTPVSGARVIITPLCGLDPVIKINSGGNGSTIRGLTITAGSYSIYMDSVSNCNITGNSISGNFNGIYLTGSTNNTITRNTITETGIGIVYLNSSNTAIAENNITRSQIQDIRMIDPTGIMMSSTTSNCGPASLATVLKNMNINASQEVLAAIAGTDESGTTMYGLAQAAGQQQGVFVKGLKLTVNDLRPGNIVYLVIAGEKHYSIIKSINGSIVYLADTDLGNINMTIGNFTAAYIQNTATGYGYALVVTNNSTDPQLNNTNTLTDDEMKVIKGTSVGGAISVATGWGEKNPEIKNLAQTILKWARYPQTKYRKGLAIWNWITNGTNKNVGRTMSNKKHPVYPRIGYDRHDNTKWPPSYVLKIKRANCAEMARLVVCLARAMGVPYFHVRYVHKIDKDEHGNPIKTRNPINNKEEIVPGHYWAQIWTGVRWEDIDCTLQFYPDKPYYIKSQDARYYGGYMDLYDRFGGWSKYREYKFNGWEIS